MSVSSTRGLYFRSFCTNSKKFAQGKNTHAESPPLILFTHTSSDESGLAARVHNHDLWESKSQKSLICSGCSFSLTKTQSDCKELHRSIRFVYTQHGYKATRLNTTIIRHSTATITLSKTILALSATRAIGHLAHIGGVLRERDGFAPPIRYRSRRRKVTTLRAGGALIL